MDDIAEKGIAAHWTYKREGYLSENGSEMDKWLEKVKEILVSPDVNALELLDIIHNDLISSDIMVFTPKGDQKTMKKGATALDFALCHPHRDRQPRDRSESKHELVPLSHVLKTGDQVEIITAENEHPKKEWLQFLHTRHARNVVIDFFKGRRKEVTESGKQLLSANLSHRDTEQTMHPLPSSPIIFRSPVETWTNSTSEQAWDCSICLICPRFCPVMREEPLVALPWFKKSREKEAPKKAVLGEYVLVYAT